jgi:hypothetical protein
LRLIDNAEAFPRQKNQRVGLLAWRGGFPNPMSSQLEIRRSEAFAVIRNLTDRGDLREAAANLFGYLRELDALGLDLIVAERIPCQGLGAAIMDRLERASHR